MSGTIIVTKNSTNSIQPGSDSLAQGEQAYSFASQKLYIGDSNSPVVDITIGGKFYTDQLKHELDHSDKGQLEANKAIVVDSNSKIDIIHIDNITIDANTISTTDAGGNLILNPLGLLDIQANTNITGTLEVSSNASITLNTTIGGTLDVDGQSTLASLNVEDLSPTRLTFAGASGELVDDANLAWTSNVLYVTGAIDVDNIKLDGNTISSTDANGDIIIQSSGTGDIVMPNFNGVLQLPSGSLASRKAAGAGTDQANDGAIRYNTFDGRFEGVVNNAWTGLGGVVDVNQDTYIDAEESTNDDHLRFYAAGTQEAYINDSGMWITDQLTVPIATITTAGITTANIGTANVTTQLQVDADANFTVGIDVIAGDVDITDNLNVSGNAIIDGDLTVRGNTTSINTTVTTLKDPVISLGDGSTAAPDLIDRGINFTYGHDNAGTNELRTGFFGFDNASNRFVYKENANNTDEDYDAPWGDAGFGNLFLSGGAIVNDNLSLFANSITTAAGNLTISPAGALTTVNGAFDVNGNITITGATDLNSTLNVDGNSTLNGTTTLGVGAGAMFVTAAGVMTHGTIDGGSF